MLVKSRSRDDVSRNAARAVRHHEAGVRMPMITGLIGQRRYVWVVGLALAAASCQSPGAPVDWSAVGVQMPPSIDASDLPESGSDGARLVARYCSQCHGVPSPASHGAADWVPTVRRMLERMSHSAMMGPGMGMMGRMPVGMHGAQVPSSTEAGIMLDYLQRHALLTIAPAEVEEAEAADAELFVATCSRCHALPAPGQHVPAEWNGVVSRMRQHMRDLQVPEITDADASVIVAYLERIAGR